MAYAGITGSFYLWNAFNFPGIAYDADDKVISEPSM